MSENIDGTESETTARTSNAGSLETEQQTACRSGGSAQACDACETTRYDDLHEIALGEHYYEVCEDCLHLLVETVEAYHWWDRLTEAHYDRAAAYLRSLESVWCVHDHAYAGGELWIHTPYCDAAVVRDVCDHFGFQIRWFSVVYPAENGFECVGEHGPCLEINLTFPTRRSTPLPLASDIQEDVGYHEAEWLADHHRLFDPSSE